MYSVNIWVSRLKCFSLNMQFWKLKSTILLFCLMTSASEVINSESVKCMWVKWKVLSWLFSKLWISGLATLPYNYCMLLILLSWSLHTLYGGHLCKISIISSLDCFPSSQSLNIIYLIFFYCLTAFKTVFNLMSSMPDPYIWIESIKKRCINYWWWPFGYDSDDFTIKFAKLSTSLRLKNSLFKTRVPSLKQSNPRLDAAILLSVLLK